MCGVVGYLGYEDKVLDVVQITKRLEYRGYDSAGIHTTYDNGSFFFFKDVGSIDNIRSLISEASDKLNEKDWTTCSIISHTRWATSSVVSQANAHPHNSREMHIVHNGIFNLEYWHNMLMPKEIPDTKKFITLVAESLEAHKFHFGTKEEAIPKILCDIVELENLGDNVAIMKDSDMKDKLFILITGNKKLFVSENGFLCSDLASLSGFAKKAKTLKAGIYSLELRNGHKNLYRFFKSSNVLVDKRYLPFMFDIDIPSCDFDNTDMLTEIHEQSTMKLDQEDHIYYDPKCQVNLIGCGSSYNAALLASTFAKYAHKETPQITVHNGNEFLTGIRTSPKFYNDIVVDRRNTFITQSGTTHDIVSSIDILAKLGKFYDVITNNPHNIDKTKIIHCVDLGCGPEFAVAATKTFTQTVLNLTQFINNSKISPDMLNSFQKSLNSIFLQEKTIKNIANSVSKYRNILILGSKTNYAVALEGALKLKEVSYIHAEGILGSEIKHGPIALIDDDTLSIVLLNSDFGISKELGNNADEISSRGGKRLFIYTSNFVPEMVLCKSDMEFKIDAWFGGLYDLELGYVLESLMINVVLQLISYYAAKAKGINPNMPRHLAKSVTV